MDLMVGNQPTHLFIFPTSYGMNIRKEEDGKKCLPLMSRYCSRPVNVQVNVGIQYDDISENFMLFTKSTNKQTPKQTQA